MAIEFTDTARALSQQTNVKTNMVLEIEGVTDVFGTIDVKKYIRIGDDGLLIDGSWTIGGFRVDPNSQNIVNYDKGTSKKISQILRPDKFEGNQTSTFVVSLTDINEKATILSSRGGVLDDLMGKRVALWQGFDDSGWKQDYVVFMRGRIQSIESGPTYVSLHIKNTEENKRRKIFRQRQTTTTGAITAGPVSTIGVTTIGVFTDPSTAGRVNGDPEDQLDFLARIDNEYFSFTGISGSDLTGVTRGVLTTEADHDSGASIQTAYRFTGPMMQIALRIMLSGWNGPHDSGVEVDNINVIDVSNNVQNALLFKNVDVEAEFGVVEGSYVTLTGSASNDFTNRVVSAVVRTALDSYVIVDGPDLTDEIDTAGTVSFRSQFDTFGQGLRMHPNELDISKHLEIFNTFLSTFEIDIIVDEIANAKEFIDRELYGIFGCYSILRKGRSSVNFQAVPLPGNRIFELNQDCVVNPEKLKIRRDLTKYFYNSIDYKFEKNYDSGQFDRVENFESDKSKEQIIETDAPLTITANGVRASLNGQTLASRTAARFLARYQFGAEFVTGIEVQKSPGFEMEIGDVVLLDTASLKMTDYDEGSRSGNVKVFEIMNKSFDQEKSVTVIDILNTAFSTDTRFGRIAPSSNIGAGSSTTKINLVKSYGTPFFKQETFKWADYVGQTVRVRRQDYSQVAETTLNVVNDGSLNVDALPWTPSEGDIVTAPFYNTDTDPNVLAFWKAKHCYLGKKILVASYISQTQFTVSAGEIQFFQVGQALLIHDQNYSNQSPVTEIEDITGTTITIKDATGFVFDSTFIVRYASFPDSGFAYRYV